MTILFLVFAGAAVFTWIQLYKGEDNRIPPANTRKGKQARIVGAILLPLLAISLLTFVVGLGSNQFRLIAIENIIFGGFIAIMFALSRMNGKSK